MYYKIINWLIPVILIASIIFLAISIIIGKSWTEICAWAISTVGWAFAYILHLSLLTSALNELDRRIDEEKHSAHIHDSVSVFIGH